MGLEHREDILPRKKEGNSASGGKISIFKNSEV